MDSEVVVGTVLTLLLLVVGGLGVWSSVRIVREYQRLVVFRLGRSIGARGPGLVMLIPGIDHGVKVDLREQYIQVPHQTCITRDNAPVNVDCLIYMYVVDSISSVVQVQNYQGAAQGIAMTTLRAVVGDISLDDVLAKREQINLLLRTKLDEVTERWGVKVNSVEIREIIPPREVQDAMNRQMSAERNRRAVVTEAEGKREAAVTVATGEKQAAILASEGARAVLDPARRRRCPGARDGLLGGAERGWEDDEPAIPGYAEGTRQWPGDQDRDSDGVHVACSSRC